MDQIDQKEINKIVICIKFIINQNQIRISLGLVNLNERKLYFAEFLDNQFLSNLESVMIQLSPENNECDIQILTPNIEFKNIEEKLLDILEQLNIKIIDQKNYEKQNYQSDIQKLVKKNQPLMFKDQEYQNSFICLGILINHLKLNEDESNSNQFKLQEYKIRQFMKLDIAAMNALLVFPKDKTVLQTISGQYGTLIELLNRCKTKIGSRCLVRWIKQPLQDLQEIEYRLDIVEEMAENQQLRLQITDEFLRKITDLDKLFVRFYKVYSQKKGNNANLQDCYKVYLLVQSIKKIDQILDKAEFTHHKVQFVNKFNVQFKQILEDFEKLEELIEKMVDIQKAQKGEYIIRSTYSEDLFKLEQETNNVVEQIEILKNQIAKDLRIEVDLIDSNAHGFLFEVNKKEGDEAFRKSSKNYKQISVKLGKICFNNSDLKQLVEEYNRFNKQYQEKQQELVIKIVKIVSTYYPVMEISSSLISELDVLCTFAQVSKACQIQYVRPKMKEKGDLILRRSRHPCLEQMISNISILGEKEIVVVANDLNIKEKEGKVHIITGPNMGGKSTFIRQVGINVLMAHIGCFVAADYACIPIIDSIITRVGASDVQLKGISTFYQEMLEVSNMLGSATNNSLLIIDELGRGTSTHDGYGLAYSIADHIATNIQSYTLFATHFHEITQLALTNPNVKNYYVDATLNNDHIQMNYTVKEGVSHQSYAIFLMSRMNFPEVIIQDAKRKLQELQYAINYHSNSNQDQEQYQKIYLEDQKDNHQTQNLNPLQTKIQNATIQQKEQIIQIYDELNKQGNYSKELFLKQINNILN